MSQLIWIDPNIDNNENTSYSKELRSMKSLKVIKLFKKIDESIDYMKKIEFDETKIIVSGRLYTELVEKFKKNIKEMYITPKIIVFTGSKENFIELNKNYENKDNKFYTFGGIAVGFSQIKTFLNADNESKNNLLSDFQILSSDFSNDQIEQKMEETKLIIEYIDNKEKLLLPLFFKSLINVGGDDIDKYTKTLFNEYSKENDKIKDLLNSIATMANIPIELLSKYYARIYTAENFNKKLNKDLDLNKTENYLLFIKILYEGLKLKSLPLASKNTLYKGALISNNEIIKIKNYVQKKIEALPSSILFSKSFLSFYKDKNTANDSLKFENKDKDLTKVLFILEKDDNLGYNLSTHCDLEKISFKTKEKQVLFFPFSSFEIKEIKEINIGKEKGYQIKLSYLNDYLKNIENDNNIINNENKIADSEFKNILSGFGLIPKENLENINAKILYNTYKQYEKDIGYDDESAVTNNIITGKITMGKDDINREIQIISSFEKYKMAEKYAKFAYYNEGLNYENEKEIKENIEIKINGKIIDFSFKHKFEKEGEYIIEYRFKKELTNINHIFHGCKLLTHLNFSDFISKNIINMNGIFYDCKSLIDLNLSHFNTQNVIDMSYMFYGCESLINLNLSNFITQKTKSMHFMFGQCKSLKNLNLFNFSTENITNMSRMFEGCKSLINLNLLNFNTQNVIDIRGIFSECTSLTYLDLSSFNTQNISNMSKMFNDCNSLISINLSNFNTKNVTDMESMFDGCKSLSNLNLLNFDTKKVVSMNFMFNDCYSLQNLDLSSFNTQNVVDMRNMFHGCKALVNINLTSFNTKKVNNMSGMFSECNSLVSLNLANFKTQNDTDISKMFDGCNSLKNLNLSNFNTKNEYNINNVFNRCVSLKKNNVITKNKMIKRMLSD